MQLQAMSQKLDELNTEIRRRRQVEEQLREHSAKLEQDITERMLAEEALRESEQKFRTLAEALPQIVWITETDGLNIYYNQQWVDFTGLTLEESSRDTSRWCLLA